MNPWDKITGTPKPREDLRVLVHAATLLRVSAEDLRVLVRAADNYFTEYGSDDDVRAASRAAEAIGVSFVRDHNLQGR